MSQPILNKKESVNDSKVDLSELSTEDEVKMLKQELQKKQKELESVISEKKAETEATQEEPKEKEIKKEKEKIRISPEDPSKSKQPQKIKKFKKSRKPLDDDIAEDLKEIMSMDKPKQVKTLIVLAFQKGVYYAANIADKLKDPYLLDEFHDTIVDDVYELLKKKKKI